MITAEQKVKRQKNGNIHRYVYYHCTKRAGRVRCTQSVIEVKALEDQIAVYLATLRLPEPFQAWVRLYLPTIHDQEVAAHAEVRKTQQCAYAACVQRLENLLQLKLSPANTDGTLLSDEEYGRQRSQLLTEKARLEEKLRDAEPCIAPGTQIVEQTFVFACHAWEWFVHGTLEEKRQILMAVGSNLMLTNKILRIDAKKPFVVLKEGLQMFHGAPPPLEPLNYGRAQPQNGATPTHVPRWCTIVEDVRTALSETKDISVPVQKLLEKKIHTNLYPIPPKSAS